MHYFMLCPILFQETCEIGKVGQDYSPHFELMSHRLQKEVNGHANALCNGSCNVSDGPDANELCQRALCNVLVSEKFSSLCKVLLENFKGMKPETVFDFSVINSRLKEQAYEQSPTLFLSDIHQVIFCICNLSQICLMWHPFCFYSWLVFIVSTNRLGIVLLSSPFLFFRTWHFAVR